MIEINLLPGAERRKTKKTGGGLSLKLPESMPTLDRMALFIVAAWIIGIGAGLWLYLGIQKDLGDTRVALEQAVADSTRYASVISTQTQLRARQDTIAQKLEMIQRIDAGRYVWPHIMDEVSRALPPFTWLESLDQTTGGATPGFQLEGRTGSLPALTRFMDALEASPFLRNVQLVSSEQATVAGSTSPVNDFVLTGTYETPPLEVVETVPLFDEAQADTIMAGEGTDGTGTS